MAYAFLGPFDEIAHTSSSSKHYGVEYFSDLDRVKFMPKKKSWIRNVLRVQDQGGFGVRLEWLQRIGQGDDVREGETSESREASFIMFVMSPLCTFSYYCFASRVTTTAPA